MNELFKNKYFQAAAGIIVVLFSLSLYNIFALRKLKKQVDKPQPEATDQGEPIKANRETQPEAPTLLKVVAEETKPEPVELIQFPTNNEMEKLISELEEPKK